jgi:hypothetical protein
MVGVVFGEVMACCSLINWSIIFEGWNIEKVFHLKALKLPMFLLIYTIIRVVVI